MTVHSLGAIAAAPATVQVEDSSGRVVASAPVPALPAPLDLRPKTARVAVALAKGTARHGLRVTVRSSTGDPEVTALNNKVVLPLGVPSD